MKIFVLIYIVATSFFHIIDSMQEIRLNQHISDADALVLHSQTDGKEVTVSGSLWLAAFALTLQRAPTRKLSHDRYAVTDLPRVNIEISSARIEELDELLKHTSNTADPTALALRSSSTDLLRDMCSLNCRPNHILAHAITNDLANMSHNTRRWIAEPQTVEELYQELRAQNKSLARHFAMYLYLTLNKQERLMCGPYFDGCIRPLGFTKKCPSKTLVKCDDLPELSLHLHSGIETRHYTREQLTEFARFTIEHNLTPFVFPLLTARAQLPTPENALHSLRLTDVVSTLSKLNERDNSNIMGNICVFINQLRGAIRDEIGRIGADQRIASTKYSKLVLLLRELNNADPNNLNDRKLTKILLNCIANQIFNPEDTKRAQQLVHFLNIIALNRISEHIKRGKEINPTDYKALTRELDQEHVQKAIDHFDLALLREMLKNASEIHKKTELTLMSNNTALMRELINSGYIDPYSQQMTSILIKAIIFGFTGMIITLLDCDVDPLALSAAVNVPHPNRHSAMVIDSYSHAAIPLVPTGTPQTVLEHALLMYYGQRRQYEESARQTGEKPNTQEYQKLRDICCMLIDAAATKHNGRLYELFITNPWVGRRITELRPDVARQMRHISQNFGQYEEHSCRCCTLT